MMMNNISSIYLHTMGLFAIYTFTGKNHQWLIAQIHSTMILIFGNILPFIAKQGNTYPYQVLR